MRIDVHTHLISLAGEGGAFIRRGASGKRWLRILSRATIENRPPHDKLIGGALDTLYLDTLVRALRASTEIDRAVLLAFDLACDSRRNPDPDASFAYIPNNLVFDAATKHPDIFLPGVSINPNRQDALDELERCHALGASLVKWVPNSQNIDPSDKQFTAFYDRMAELKLPLLSHTGYEHALRSFDQSFGDPRRLTLPLERGVTVIAAHAGASGKGHPIEYFPHFLEMLPRFPNLFGDIAALTWPNRAGYLRQLLDRPELFDRMVQGSDYPVPIHAPHFAPELGALRSAAMQFGNYFDAEARLKKALGVPDHVFTRAAGLLRIVPAY